MLFFEAFWDRNAKRLSIVLAKVKFTNYVGKKPLIKYLNTLVW